MSDIDEIKSRLDIIDVISRYIPVKKLGANFKAVCPFHQEKTPSFVISPDKQIWHCFGCGRGGDAFTFVMEFEKVDFPEAAEILAAQAGVTLTKKGRSIGADVKDRLFVIQETAAKYFVERLSASDEGRKAMQYLINRGLHPNTISHFKIGFAEKTYEGLTRHLQRLGFTNSEISSSGLVVERDGRMRDKFVARIIFPIEDHLGRIIGFTGRALTDDAQPKYLNSPDTPIFNKGRVLYGLGQNREAIKAADWAVLVEGQMDMLSAWQAGIKNVAATSGTALTFEQLKLLGRVTGKLIVAFDSDDAGRMAARKAVGLTEEAGLTAKLAVFDAHDPDEAIRQDPAVFADSLKSAKPLIGYFMELAVGKYLAGSPAAKKEALVEVADLINSVMEPVAREQLLKESASKLLVSEASLRESVAAKVSKKPVLPGVKQELAEKDAGWLEARFMGLLLTFPSQVQELELPHTANFLSSPLWQEIYRKYLDVYTKNGFDQKALFDALDDTHKTLASEAALIAEEEYGNLDKELIGQELTFFKQIFGKRNLQARRDTLSLAISLAERSGDEVQLQKLLAEFKELI
jgi:DNA primase